MSIADRIKRSWNAFVGRDPTRIVSRDLGPSSYYRPDRMRFSRGNERSIITSVYNKISIDVASTRIRHVKLDEQDRLKEFIKSSLDSCLTLEANLDQTGRAFIQDYAMSLFDEGCVALLPTETDINPDDGSFDILSMRVAKITKWYPNDVTVEAYDERVGKKKEITVPKRTVAIIENPHYAVMNEYNSTAQRLIRKLNILDAIDEQSGSGKLDMIIQLPYAINHESRRAQAEERRSDIERQLANSKYGIAYVGNTEHITQLNRPISNNLMTQIEYLTSMLYSQLGITVGVLDGTADEKTMLNYYDRTVEPVVAAIVDEIKRKFLTKTARTQGQSIMFFRDPFRLIPVSEIAELSDKLTRNEVLTSNEVRQAVGFKPSDDPNADILRNKNLSQSKDSEIEHVPTKFDDND